MLKPDVVAVRDRSALVVDSQVVTDSLNLEEASKTKVRKYDTLELRDNIKKRYKVDRVHVVSCTFNWRGIAGGSSLKELLQHGVISRSELKILSTRVLIGGLAAFRAFTAATTWRRRPPR